jgi:hypothetical protein
MIVEAALPLIILTRQGKRLFSRLGYVRFLRSSHEETTMKTALFIVLFLYGVATATSAIYGLNSAMDSIAGHKAHIEDLISN